MGPGGVGEEQGIEHRESRHSVDETVKRLEQILNDKGVQLFVVIDHSGEAAKVGLQMRSTKLLVFGNPKAGTPLMLAAPSSAIDLPLKLLVWQDETGKTWISYNSPEYLRARHRLALEPLPTLAVTEALAAVAAK